MTINEYLSSLRELPHKSKDGKTIAEAMGDVAQVWDNDACIGYALGAMEKAGLDKKTQKKVRRRLYWLFNDWTLEDAARYADNWQPPEDGEGDDEG